MTTKGHLTYRDEKGLWKIIILKHETESNWSIGVPEPHTQM